jgi:hypothetical protein
MGPKQKVQEDEEKMGGPLSTLCWGQTLVRGVQAEDVGISERMGLGMGCKCAEIWTTMGQLRTVMSKMRGKDSAWTTHRE